MARFAQKTKKQCNNKIRVLFDTISIYWRTCILFDEENKCLNITRATTYRPAGGRLPYVARVRRT